MGSRGADAPGSGTDNARTAELFFELLGRRDIDAWSELWHDDGAILVPYPLEGFPSRIEGEEAILTCSGVCSRTSNRSLRSSPVSIRPLIPTRSASSTETARFWSEEPSTRMCCAGLDRAATG